MAVIRWRRVDHRSLPALFLLLLVLHLSISTAKKQEKSSSDDGDLADSALIDWIRASGGHSDVRIGLVVGAPAGAEPTSTRKNKTNKKRRRRKGKKGSSSSSLRGTIATRDIAAGEAIIRLPSNISVPLGGTGVTSPENVVLLFARRASDPAWFRELAPYWDSLPASVFTKEMYEPEHMELLQDEELAKLARNEVSWIERVFSGETMEGRTPSLKEACAAEGTAPIARPTLGEFRHLTAVVASYAFHLPDDEGTDRTVLLPLLDLVNHANAGVANTVVAREGEDFTARALRDIREGEEVTHMYSHGNARNDHSVLHYGFLDRSRWEQPRVCCSDLDGADLWNCSAVDRDSRELDPAEQDALQDRYAAKLASFPTSVRDDESVLSGLRDQTAWKARLLLEFRVLRKRALQQAIDNLRAMPERARDEL